MAGKKQQKPQHFENHERWLIAYADMMTLLFALFVVLYAIATVEMAKLKHFSDSVQKAFGLANEDKVEDEGEPMKGSSRHKGIFEHIKGNTNRDQIMNQILRERIALIDADAKKLEQTIANRLYGSKIYPDSTETPKDRLVYVARDPDGIRVTIVAMQFFGTGDYTISKNSKRTLDGIAVAIRALGRLTRVEGHTDNVPYRKGPMNNWELSALRAVSVVEYFVKKHNFPSNYIYAAGYGDSRPIASNETERDRALNRRIDIKILYDTPKDYIDASERVSGRDD